MLPLFQLWAINYSIIALKLRVKFMWEINFSSPIQCHSIPSYKNIFFSSLLLMTWVVCCYFCSWLIAISLFNKCREFHTQWIFCSSALVIRRLPDSSILSLEAKNPSFEIKFTSLCMTDVICNFCNRDDHLLAARINMSVTKTE